MKEIRISVTEAARKLGACVDRVQSESVTFVVLKRGSPVARIVPEGGRILTGKELAKALAKVPLSEEEARAWREDLQSARKSLIPARDKWQ